MEFAFNFIRRSAEFATLESPVSAPLFRRAFTVGEGFKQVKLQITGLGFYEVHLNGEDITKGFLAPYRSNPTARDVNEVDISPVFPSGMMQAKASHILPSGELQVAWTREEDTIKLVVSAPNAVHGRIVLPSQWKFAQGETVIPLQGGIYKLSHC